MSASRREIDFETWDGVTRSSRAADDRLRQR
jgi:hypothetical protein